MACIRDSPPGCRAPAVYAVRGRLLVRRSLLLPRDGARSPGPQFPPRTVERRIMWPARAMLEPTIASSRSAALTLAPRQTGTRPAAKRATRQRAVARALSQAAQGGIVRSRPGALNKPAAPTGGSWGGTGRSGLVERALTTATFPAPLTGVAWGALLMTATGRGTSPRSPCRAGARLYSAPRGCWSCGRPCCRSASGCTAKGRLAAAENLRGPAAPRSRRAG